jgi:hypothetical protein
MVSQPMALTPGTNLVPYEIQAPLGSGGMGEVYRAKDTRLGRDVALKILPESFARETERLRRFEQEARAVAVLNHPNILAIHDIGQHQGLPFLPSYNFCGAAFPQARDSALAELRLEWHQTEIPRPCLRNYAGRKGRRAKQRSTGPAATWDAPGAEQLERSTGAGWPDHSNRFWL